MDADTATDPDADPDAPADDAVSVITIAPPTDGVVTEPVTDDAVTAPVTDDVVTDGDPTPAAELSSATELSSLPPPPPPLPPPPLPPPPAGAGRLAFHRRHQRRLVTTAAAAATVLLVPVVTYAQALTKEGQESVPARTAQWARDLRLGFLVDWAERRTFAADPYEDATGAPDATAFSPSQTTAEAPPAADTRSTTTTRPPVPHLTPPSRMPGPVQPMADGEGEWVPIGPLTGGLPGVHTTKVRPDAKHTSLTIFVAWIDPLLTSIELFPGTNLPGGTWDQPHHIPAERCPQAIMAANGGFRMDQSRGGYYAEGREPYKLRDGAASLVLYKDGRVDVGQWGRDVGRDRLPEIAAVRQNLELMVDGGRPVADLLRRDWGAELPNSYFVWRSAWGVTAAGALVYVGGPALKPDDLARHLVNAGAVRAMQGDINPEWVTAIVYRVGDDGRCSGRRGLQGQSNHGGMYSSENRYLSTDTRDFIGVFAR